MRTHTRPRVWGIGLTRTGTTSLSAALRHLGYASIHWPTLTALLYGDLEAATDESVAAMFAYLDRRFPGSKFVITERDEGTWLASTARHRAQSHKKTARLLSRPLEDLSAIERDRWVEIQFTQTFLYGTVEFDERLFVLGFRRYHERVREYFAGREHDLLRLRLCDGDGWGPLCDFLETSIPAVCFPSKNASKSRPLPHPCDAAPATPEVAIL